MRATASIRLSVGENATLVIYAFSDPENSCTACPVAASHNRRARAPLAEAIHWPPGEKRATDDHSIPTGRIAAPAFSKSQIRAVLSAPTLASRFPSVEKRTAL